ncbi:restriction endonuclease subunit S [Streptomyces scabiei]|uniref:restriction endonuclease subunit S n=1 Tax=Streptomyces scabiei TaxID=1930 RepID=UPI00099DF29D|nr:restriction endonuclease subunit S [Streptomyces scabiei]
MSEKSDLKTLPQGWAWATLGELATSVKNGIYVSRPGTEPNGIPILRISAVRPMALSTEDLRYTGMSIAEVQAKDGLAHPGDLLFTRYNGNPALVGACARVPDGTFPVAYPDKLIRVSISNSVANSRFLCYAWAWSETQQQVRAHVKTTAGQAGISGASLKSIRLPIPPLVEQERIVNALEDHLSRLDAAEVLVERCSIRLRRLRDTVSNPTFGHTVDVDADAATFPAPAGTIDGDLPRVPRGWRWRRLEDVAEVVGGVTKDSKKQSDPALPEVPYLRVANVQRGRLDLNQISLIRVPAKKAEALALHSGDVLMNEGGDRDKLGRGWVWEGQIPGAIHQNHVFRARVLADEIDPKLLSWYANSSGRWFELNGKQSVNLASISLSKIKKFPFPVPPKAEQRRIVERVEDDLSVMDNVSSLVARSRLRSTSLRRALLSRAFSGQLVHQDPNDEPAQVMLARVAAERAASPAKPARRRSSRRTRTAPVQQESDV